ncbi:MAG: Uma2 family endonuclease [Bryobacteraceae bacterium]|nr:Uma2 family endonuclease [Bryobacteraceae bacterium]
MPSTLIAPPIEFENLPRKKWTRDECAQLSGLFDLHQYELINGELIRKMGKNHPHIRTMVLLLEWLRSVFPTRNVVQEIPIDVWHEDNPSSEPEPDVVVLAQSVLALVPRPKAADVLLLVEVSDTTLAFDLKAKAGLYARAEIQDYWVLDVNQRRLIVHRLPREGVYQDISVFAGTESVAALATPEAPVVVASLF